VASMKEAERIALHVFGYHLPEIEQQRALLLQTMEYTHGAGAEGHGRTPGSHLDGLFSVLFERATRGPGSRSSTTSTRTRPDGRGRVAFVVIFLTFLDDPTYYVMT